MKKMNQRLNHQSVEARSKHFHEDNENL